MQTFFQFLDAHFFDNIVRKGHHEQHTGFGLGNTARAHVEKCVTIELSHCGTVAAFYIIGIYFELRLGIDVRFFGGTEVAVGLYGRGLLRTLTHENPSVENTRCGVFEHIFEEFVACAVGRFVVDKGKVVDQLPLVGYGHAIEMCLGMFSGQSDIVIVAGIAVVQGDTVDQYVRCTFLLYECRGDAVRIESRFFEVVVVEGGISPDKNLVDR